MGARSAARSANRPTSDKRSIQMVFQNPDSALNRGWTARQILARSVTKLTGLKGKAVSEVVAAIRAVSPLSGTPRSFRTSSPVRVSIATSKPRY